MARQSRGQSLNSPAEDGQRQITLRAGNVPDADQTDVEARVRRQILRAFQQRWPNVTPAATTGLELTGSMTMDMIPLMQIAGDIPPHVLYVNFRKSDTYINQLFLSALDHYMEQACWGEQWDEQNPQYIPNSHILTNEEYLNALKELPHYEEVLQSRVPEIIWQVIRRKCPYQMECPYCREWGLEPTEEHYHTWAFPQGPIITALTYRRDLFAEADLPDRVPRDWEEFLQTARVLTNPRDKRYGLSIVLAQSGWGTLSFLYSAGGLIVEQDESGTWRCVFNSEEAVDAYYFVARLFIEPFENEHGTFSSVVFTGDPMQQSMQKIGMAFSYIDEKFFGQRDINTASFGPVPLGPTGQRGSEFNCRMTGIYAGLDDDPEMRDAAWDYMLFFDSREARQIRTEFMVQEGLGQFVRPQMLIEAGYPEYVRQVPQGWEEALQAAMESGVPEPYGKNCDLAYGYVSNAVDQIRTDPEVRESIEAGAELTLRRRVQAGEITQQQADQLAVEYRRQAKARIQEILDVQVEIANVKMLNLLSPEEQTKRNRVALMPPSKVCSRGGVEWWALSEPL